MNALRQSMRQRRGAILVLSAVLMIVIFAMAAMGIDVGYMMLMRTQLQVAADSGSLAAANVLHLSRPEIIATAREFAAKHKAGSQFIRPQDVTVELGIWDARAKTFEPVSEIGNAVRVTARRENANYFFARVLGFRQFDLEASAIALATPRDIAFVVDLSGSMNDDTEPAWATSTVNAAFRSTVGNELMQSVYADFGFGSFPGTLQYVGEPLGVTQNSYAYAEMTKDDGPLADSSIPAEYRIKTNDNEKKRKVKAYSWIIDHQIAAVMPAALPVPNSATNYSYWEKYLDYIIQPVKVEPPPPPKPPSTPPTPTPPPTTPPASSPPPSTPPTTPSPTPKPSPPKIGHFVPQLPGDHTSAAGTFARFLFDWPMFAGYSWGTTVLRATILSAATATSSSTKPGTPPVNRGWLPPDQDGDRITGFNNPNMDTFPSADRQLPSRLRNWIGYLTYVQFMMDHGRNLQPNNTQLVPLSADSGICPMHAETTAGGAFTFPPREQPMHACRRSLIAALAEIEERNSEIPDPLYRDYVSLVTYDTVAGTRVAQPLTADYQEAMQSCTLLQAVGDKLATTATEAGLADAAKLLRKKSEGGGARDYTDKVAVLLTDGVPNVYQSSDRAIDKYVASHPEGEFYGNSTYAQDAALMQTMKMYADRIELYPVGVGLGTDYDFMDRLARAGGTAGADGRSPRGSGDPAEYEKILTDIFRKLVMKAHAKLVQ